jgi:hypothetical protein
LTIHKIFFVSRYLIFFFAKGTSTVVLRQYVSERSTKKLFYQQISHTVISAFQVKLCPAVFIKALTTQMKESFPRHRHLL